MLRIVHIDSESGFSGGEVQVFLLIEALARRGHENVLVCPPGSRAQDAAEERGITSHAQRMRNDADLGSVLALARWLRGSGADLVHLHTGRATWLGGLAAHLAKVPALTTRRMDRRVKRGLRTRLLYDRLLGATVAISPAVRDCLVEGGVDASVIRLIWDAVDPRAFEPSRPRDAVRADLGIADGELALLTMAALVRRKGIDVLIDALAELRARDVPARLLVGGEGEERAELERHVRRLELEDRVHLLGFRSDKADLLAACDVFVLPSRREGVGVAALEAMAASRPVVASRVGGLSQAVEDGVSGLLVPPEDPRALAEVLERLAGDPALRESLAAAGRQRVLERFSIEAQAEQYLEVYGELLARRTAS